METKIDIHHDMVPYILSDVCRAHLTDDVRNDKIQSTIVERPWTWVVIQEQSQIPAFYDIENSEYKESVKAASTLNNWISSANGQTVLLMTWGQRFGDAMNPGVSPNFPVMQERLKTGYDKIQDHLSTPERPVLVVPAGMAFQAVYDASGSDPTADGTDFTRLFQDDGKHPSMEGSYLTACAIYYTLTGKHPSHLKYKPRNMSVARAQYLQTMAGSATDRYNEMNTFNQQYYEAAKKRSQNNKDNPDKHDSQKDKKPYVAPEGGVKSSGLHSSWILVPILVVALALVTWKQQLSKTVMTKWGISPRRVKNPSVYRQIQTDDMELVGVPGETNA
eukprot:scaffold1640_cov161-Amphora_coffeaeformis.AAC.48